MSARSALREAREPRVGGRGLSQRAQLGVSLASLLVFFAGWESLAAFGGVPRIFLPRFSAVLAEIPEMHREGVLLENAWISVRIYLIGMALSIVVAIPMGLVIGGIRILDKLLSPYVWAIYTVPRIILMPMVLLWVGINDAARVVIVVLSAVPATLVVVMEGVRTVDPLLLRAARAFCASRWKRFAHVALPATVPFIATGVRMGVARGLIGLFIGELFTAASGIGFVMSDAARRFDTARVFATLLVFVAFSLVVVELSRTLERRVSRWRSIPIG